MNGAHVFRTHESIVLANDFKEALDFMLQDEDLNIANIREGDNGLVFDVPQPPRQHFHNVWGILKHDPIKTHLA